ncbi:UDP-N-acetylglucosamine 2-epimerase (non-hydrolyzing) [Psychromicrobium silvestre]|uniref:UDP-N-acetylglucosamine 2-epimerase (Non-hydrolyzing) n=1 Tax=Psychromicrobium silvestre TaxID=1645614 RepID=A0A7Y9LSN7_9MICC|nr:UDP-N-acetylglucosamine 2-epimerase (non-hydrolyzing) [Psychromicrobium silvestre]NYE94884.1 UDP-N-acetylglucosamine 2-epimerase (non-hydrolyzing) [Psychromicrobium silvestre]
MRILSVVGARPQFVKLAPIAAAMKGRAEHLIAHTGQHYDQLMSDVFFRDLQIPAPQYNLGVGSGKHGAQTGAMLTGLEEIFEQASPDCVLVYGDTNSTLAAAIASVKLHIPLVHLEAGLRSFNRRMPEEHNRVLTDHSADLLLAPTQVAVDHLRTEGLADKTALVGDVMTDVLFQVRDRLAATERPLPLALPSKDYYVCTIHRPDNTDSAERLSAIVSALAELDKPVVLLAHPRLVSLAQTHNLSLEQGSIRVTNPLAYPDLIHAVMNSAGVVTDSGGLQKEAFLLRVPCTTVRTETEWVETVELGWNRLVGNDLRTLTETVQRPAPSPTDATPYGDGKAAQYAVDAILRTFAG